jgi:ATP-dependent DNA helicase RecG
MQTSLEKLQKYFRLEADSGYQDRAVIGGLVKMLDFWEGEARNDGVPEEIIEAVVSRLRDYHSLPPSGRQDALKGLWKRIQTLSGNGGPQARPDGGPERRAMPREPRSQPAPASEQAVVPPSWDVATDETATQPTAQVAPGESAPGPHPAKEAGARPPRPAQSPVHAAEQRREPPAPRAEQVVGAKTSQTPAALNAKLTVLSGIGPRISASLEKLGLYTLGDMLYYFPRRYDDYSQLKPIHRLFYGEVVTVIGMVQSVSSRSARGGKMQIVEAIISDGTGALRLTWFNQPWLLNRLKEGLAISVSGRIEQYLGRLVLNSPDWEPVETENLHTNRIVPVYSLTANITQKWLRQQMNQVVTHWAPRVADPLPETIRREAGVWPLGRAIEQAHFPESQGNLKDARQRLAFDEIFYLQVGVLRQKRDWQSAVGRIFDVPEDWLAARAADLPFTLTGAQQRALDDIVVDVGSGRPMNRLLQGDVGSGKTVIAALAAGIVNRAGAQAAVMAPTSILAEQHYKSFTSLLAREDSQDGNYLRPEQVRLLVGDTPAGERKEILDGLADCTVKVLIGTHALIEEPVQFADLALTVIDEQHRFGVEQRAALRAKGNNPHLLVMTATPIPRSLALTVFGDLDLSVMDEMPAGRMPVATHLLTPAERERAYSLIRSQMKAGRQAFIVYPLIEESDHSDSKAAVDEHDVLQREIFPDLKLGLLHGRMRAEEKDRTMAEFRDRKYDILVSTTVIEVGVDVPNATVMLIEGAERFGLAQLHQLRGRVGRGGGEAFCLLIPGTQNTVDNERLQAMVKTNDGFELADMDLHQRGPGEFLGTRQAGFASTLRMASLTDIALIEKARGHAQNLFARDPDLKDPEHTLLAEAVDRFWGKGGDVS